MADPLIILAEDLIALAAPFGVQQWGIFLDGVPVIIADSVQTFDFKTDRRISNYPVEQGGFESYNKVSLPYDVRVRYATGGSAADRANLIDSVEAIIDSLDLFDVVTPEKVYTSANPVHYDYRRTNVNGVGLLQIDIFLEEIRVTASQSFSNTKSPTGAAPVAGGNVLPQAPTQNQVTQIPAVQ
jgi:hypothetical protein